MTKLSDALRGAADRAPVSDVSISADVTARRVARQRGMRGAANGLVGVGAVGVLALGVMSPGLGLFDGAGAEDSAASGDESMISGPMMEGGADGADRFASDMAYCGYPGGFESPWGEPTVSYSAELEDGATSAGGDSIGVAVTATAQTDTSLETAGPQVMVLWDGLVVGHMQPDGEYSELVLSEGESATTVHTLDLVNCWDGAALPAGDYQLLVSQMFTAPQAAPVDPVEPSPDQPTVEPTVDPTELIDPEAGATDSAVEGSMEILPVFSEFFVIAETVPVSLDGDVVENPFAEYLQEQPEPVDLPDNYLTPEIARALYNDAVQEGSWNMAPGTQRWVMQNSADQQYDETAWERSYFGCSWDGTQGNSFPANSADMGLIDVDANLPSVLNLSYGWVVDNNPPFSLTLTNTSEYSIPGFYGQPSAQLYLVQNGSVVAESYGVNTDRNAEYGIAQDGAQLNAAQQLGLLEPEGSIDGEFLWREVSGCWTDRGGPGVVNPGTYTVLSAQYVHVSAGDQFAYYGGIAGPEDSRVYEEQAAADDSMGDAATSYISGDMDIMPYPGETYDWVELVVWTSLGTVTLTE